MSVYLGTAQFASNFLRSDLNCHDEYNAIERIIMLLYFSIKY